MFGFELTLSFKKNVLGQTWTTFNTKFEPLLKDLENSYQVRGNFSLFLQITFSNFNLKLCERYQNYENFQANEV